ncbi:alpha-L-rhamnosidase C-terminal domain-containing protein [Streptomyces hawaiiensis]|uniref:alpha-L-rhamnosidase C-terminal domain-containing protein n=1 Tax=Streptomyces hawaiiensis TaxID=67305 RepID=UPI00364B5705
MFQNIGGLSAIEPGYKRSRIAPAPGGNLTEGSGSLKTVYGLLSSRWNTHDGALDLKVTVPVNTLAEVHVPAKTRWAVTESGRPADTAKGVRFLRMENGAAVFEVGSGTYSFGVDTVLGGLGEAKEAAGELRHLLASLDAPGAPTASEKAQQVQTSIAAAWTSHAAGGAQSTDRHVERTRARLGDIGDWTAVQVGKGTLTASQGTAVQALIDRIEKGL